MKLTITVDLDVSDTLALQAEQTGFAVVCERDAPRVKIGRTLVLASHAKVSIQRGQPGDDHHGKPSAKE